MIRLLALWLGKLVLAAARLRGGGGSALPGLVVERLYPRLLDAQVARLPEGCLVVTGTNGKTTTVKMLTTALESSGRRVLTNRTGSNMVRGLLSTVIEESTWTGRLAADVAVFEVDEPNVPAVARATAPRLLLVLNLHRDQLDRYGELERTAELIGDGLSLVEQVLLNADDPLVARLADRAPSDRVRWFGAAPEVRDRLPDDAGLLTGAAPAEPAVESEFLTAELTHVSEEVDGQHLDLRFDREVVAVDLPMPGVYNAYNAAAALGVASLSGLEPATAAKALTGMEPAFGRGERIPVGDAALVLLLVKNPSSFTQVIRTLLARGEDRALLLAINDNFADGRDVSWLWDVDFEALRGRADRITVTGLRATDLALRLKYTEIESRVEEDPATALDDFIGALAPGETGFVVPTYTAMLELRKLLQRRADLKGFWE